MFKHLLVFLRKINPINKYRIVKLNSDLYVVLYNYPANESKWSCVQTDTPDILNEILTREKFNPQKYISKLFLHEMKSNTWKYNKSYTPDILRYTGVKSVEDAKELIARHKEFRAFRKEYQTVKLVEVL